MIHHTIFQRKYSTTGRAAVTDMAMQEVNKSLDHEIVDGELASFM